MGYNLLLMSILNNAVMAIQVGLEDFSKGTQPRLLSSIRNLAAGVLLLLKARLQELSPADSDEVLLKVKIKPKRDKSGQLTWSGSGKKTVDVGEIRERLASLGVEVDWKRVEKLAQERNNIEHYYTNVADGALRALVADVLVIVRDFTERELKKDPQVLFGVDAWSVLLENAEVAKAEKEACLEALGKVTWTSRVLAGAVGEYACEHCGSPLVRPIALPMSIEELDLECRSCGETVSAYDFVPAVLRLTNTYDPSDVGHDQIRLCPGCGCYAFVQEEDTCALCEYTREHENCLRCEESIDVEEQDLGGLCGYCRHMADKDD